MNIVGRITQDARISTLDSGKQVVNFSVAVNERYRNKQGERMEITDYFDCAYWLSAGVARVLTQGTLVELTGRVSARAWTDKEGGLRASLNFHASQIKLHGGGHRAGESDPPASQMSRAQTGCEDLPF